jgi:5-dehydro-4-deoxyglucarate dehydratase
MPLAPHELQQRLKGLFTFPVTPFTPDNEIDLRRYEELLETLLAAHSQAIFACGGTGEFFSLSPVEYRALVGAAVEHVRGAVPVIAGAGYGTALAIEFVRAAEEAGADGILLLPPYLLQSEQEGLFQHYRAVAASTRLGIILYQRDNAIFSAPTVRRLAEIPNIIALKDGLGDMERLGRIQLAVGDKFPIVNGTPTAELSALAFAGLGIYAYSSAVFNFVPEISVAFYGALTQANSKRLHDLLEDFYRPFAELRDRKRGYAVALIKAGVGLRSNPAGPVRPPLVNPSESEIEELKAVIDRGLRVLAKD